MINYFDLLAEWFEFKGLNNHSVPTLIGTKRFEELLAKKKKLIQGWELLLEDLKQTNQFLRVKDMAPVTEQYCYKAILPFKIDPTEGIILHLSPIGNLFGFNYSNYSIEAPLPVKDYNGQSHNYLSYYPFSAEHENIAQQVKNIIIKNFRDFRHFDSLDANLPCYNITIEGNQYKKIDLFQALFGANLHGMI